MWSLFWRVDGVELLFFLVSYRPLVLKLANLLCLHFGRPQSPRGRTRREIWCSSQCPLASGSPHEERHVLASAKRWIQARSKSKRIQISLCREATYGLSGHCRLQFGYQERAKCRYAAAPQRQHLQRAPADARAGRARETMPRALEKRPAGIPEEERRFGRCCRADDGAGRDDGGVRPF